MLCTLPEVGQRYDGAGTEVFKTAPEDIASDFPAQVNSLENSIIHHLKYAMRGLWRL